MKILLDTHIAIWALIESPRLSQKARDIILEPDNTVYYSVVSVWEVLLKHVAHPESVDLTSELFAKRCKDAGFELLELREAHVIAVSGFPNEVEGHKDPFDRLLLAQAMTENMRLLTHDSKLPLYPGRFVIAQ